MDIKQTLTYFIKLIALMFGLLGAYLIYISVSLYVPDFTNNEDSLNVLSYTMSIFGSIMIIIAYDVIRNYKTRSIKLLSMLLVIAFFGQISNIFLDDIPDFYANSNVGVLMLISIAPLIVMLMLYESLVFLIKTYTHVR